MNLDGGLNDEPMETNETTETLSNTPEVDLDEIIASLGEPKVPPPSGQSTLFGGDL
jgi:hypothetical protein